jgi:hypothetical protein
MPGHEDQIEREVSQSLAQVLALLSSDGETAELRDQKRHPFPVLHRIAPRHDVKLPNEQDFFQVKCYDMSAAGVSFLLAGPPSFERLVFAFVVSPEATHYFGAEVVHVTPVRVSHSGSLERIEEEPSQPKRARFFASSGRRMFLVGCRMTERLGTKPTSRLWLR